jgi:chromosome segregation protein
VVHFTKLRLSGFKSFVDPTELLIEPGVTGIVGPNGCGKSNLVEALRWVMGETSAKRMRGGEMDDVIFGGSANRPARNIAEVCLWLDNAARQVPAPFNEHEELEVVRRIERGAGSIYRVNGREARARDVQLLFADAATGAHSTALVSQGRVGAIINAKPTDRRALLEEAAGITGLHSRRHEAELRLRAAETNLSRLDDVIVTLESQFQALKKQARQATRYRNLNEHIRRADATLLHLQWLEAAERLAAAGAALQAAEAAVAERTGVAASAATRQAEAAAAMPALRQAEAAAAAELQRLTLARHALEQEEQRIAAAQRDAAQRLSQIDGDAVREGARATDAAEADQRLAAEEAELAAATAAEAGAADEAAAAVAAATADVGAGEEQLAAETHALAAAEARRAALMRRLGELQARLERLGRRLAETEAEHGRLAAAAADDASLALAQAATSAAEQAFAAAEAAAAEAEQARLAASAAEGAAREALQEAQSRHDRLAAEAGALAALFADSSADLWPPLIDALSVDPGYEAALGAALGDDLTASADAGAPVHWTQPPDDPAPPALPAGAEPLAFHVRGAPALARRLAQIGVVADEAAGRAAVPLLAQGQRLVTREGALWRWDGLVARPETPTAAATRLRQRNRLNQLRAEIATLAPELAASRDAHAERRQAATAAAAADAERRRTMQAAFAALTRAREQQAAAAQRAAAANQRLTALADQLAALDGDRGEAAAELAAAEAEQATLPDLAAARERVAARRSQLAEERTRLIECRGRHDRLQREAEARARRLAAIAGERRSWSGRAEAARHQLAALEERRQAVLAELAQLAERPAAIAAQRESLLGALERATLARRDAADRLAAGETELTAADRALKAAEAAMAAAREDRVRAESQVAQADAARDMLVERIREHLDCAPDALPGLAELDPGLELPDRAALEARLQKLLREREAIGPVNLRAEAEAAELETQITGLQTERADLVAAIGRLRQGIASLNREARERLLAAFEIVNGHFEQLFTRLFGGGRAHLKLTEAEDPLEAGLEIMASPPGKRLQVMSLLSGGEQALTALSLLFAVFLTNPAPICVLDEVDAPLDDANVDRFCSLVEELAHSTATRFLVITHHRMTMARMDRLFGVTMAERGISQLVSVDLQRAVELRATA